MQLVYIISQRGNTNNYFNNQNCMQLFHWVQVKGNLYLG
jgi:hypothetical protein